MIKLLVDEGYVFDYLSILSVKAFRTQSKRDKANYAECLDFINKQLDSRKAAEIIISTEYKQLASANLAIFDLIENLRNGKRVSAKEVDDLNLKRWKLKRSLQKKFFKRELTETKTQQ